MKNVMMLLLLCMGLSIQAQNVCCASKATNKSTSCASALVSAPSEVSAVVVQPIPEKVACQSATNNTAKSTQALSLFTSWIGAALTTLVGMCTPDGNCPPECCEPAACVPGCCEAKAQKAVVKN